MHKSKVSYIASVLILHSSRGSSLDTAPPELSVRNFYKHIFNLLKRQQFNIQQLYVLPTLYLCVLYLSENKQRLVPLTA